ncbi:MAG: IPT/TIG domain-containing protein, partial [bacterium]
MASVNTIVTITGVNFSPTQGSGKVWMNGVDAGAAISWSSTQITIKPPASLVSSNGLTQTVVTNVTVNQLASNAVAFELVPSGTVQPVDTMLLPQSITSDPSTNLLYATDLLGHVVKIDQNGVAQVIATGLLNPRGIVFTNGTLYVAENTADGSGNYWIKMVSTNGKVTPWRSMPIQPYGITNDNSGNLYVTYPADGSVSRYDINGNRSTIIASSTLTGPIGIAWVSSGAGFKGVLYIVENTNNITRYNLDTSTITRPWVSGVCTSGSASGITYQAASNVLLVSCVTNNAISKVSMTGAVSQGFITNNGAAPNGMTFDTNGNLYIANSDDLMVTKVTFTGAGNTITWFAAGPYGVYGNMGTDNAGNAYISGGFLRNLIVKLTPDNKTSIYASNDTLNGYALGCTFSPNGVMLIADLRNKKINTVPAGGGTITPWLDVAALGEPYDVAVDGSGNVFVDIAAATIAKYDASGTQVNTNFVSGLTGFAQILAQGNTLTIPDFSANNLKSASSVGSSTVAPTVLMNNIALLAVSPAPSGQFYGTDGSNIFLINPNTSSASYLTTVNVAYQIATLPDGSIITSLREHINRVYP